MAKVEKDEARERRIEMEIVVDAHDSEEREMGWFAALEDKLHCPFRARCIEKLRISPLKVGEEVVVTGKAPQEESGNAMFVLVEWQGHKLGVPLVQLDPVDADAGTEEIVGDWHYWVAQGYEF